MTQIADSDMHRDLAVQARLMRLARYRAMQLRLARDRRQQTSRRRLIALRGQDPWGWLAL